MNSNKFFLALVSIICLGSFTPEHCAQAAIAQACTTSRSLVTNGFNAWMANRKALHYLGVTSTIAFLLKYIYHVVRLGKDNKLYKEQYDHPELQDRFVTQQDYAVERAPIIESMTNHTISLNRARDYALCSILATAVATTSWKPLLAFLPALFLPRALIEVVQPDKTTYPPNALNTWREQECIICYCWLSLRHAVRVCCGCSKSKKAVASVTSPKAQLTPLPPTEARIPTAFDQQKSSGIMS